MSTLARALAALLLLAAAPTSAHELRPAYLEIRETAPGELTVLWKTPMVGDRRLGLNVEIAGEMRTAPVVSRVVAGAMVQQWNARILALRGSTLRIVGLEQTLTDALVRIELADGSSWTRRLTPLEPSAKVPQLPTPFAVASTYLRLGIEHILSGLDHLLFLLGLVLLTHGGWRLVKTVTAFTVAHTLTLSAAVLGWVHVPQKPVEAIIALSIVFVACEILNARRGRAGLSLRWPWLVALSFGLLHGLGFAGALGEIGVPPTQIPLALLFFSLGVEAGNLLFLAFVLTLRRFWRQLPVARWRSMQAAPAYAIGSLAAFWFVQRIAVF